MSDDEVVASDVPSRYLLSHASLSDFRSRRFACQKVFYYFFASYMSFFGLFIVFSSLSFLTLHLHFSLAPRPQVVYDPTSQCAVKTYDLFIL